MAVEEPKKGRVAAAILAGSALTFSSFAIGVPAAFADRESPAPEKSTEPEVDPTEDASTEPGNDESESATSPDPEGPEVPEESEDPEDGDEENDPDPSDDPEEPEEEDEGEDGAGEPSLNLDQTEVAQGASLQVDGSGFEPETSIQLVATHAESDESLETVTDTTDSPSDGYPGGSFGAVIDIPEDAALGEYNLVATSEAGDVVTTSFTVVESR